MVGTTPDYIDWIRIVRPGSSLFLTDYSARKKAAEAPPAPGEEVLSFLADDARAKKDLRRHLERWNIILQGIVCFDCESMELAANLARYYSLPYPGIESIKLCRDKYVSKNLWQKHSVMCPKVRLVQSSADVQAFMEELDGPCVIKPLTGSGSELVFRCMSKKDCDKWAQVLTLGLENRQLARLYTNACKLFIAEEFISGDEYSCDFLIHGNHLEIIRLTRKIHAEDKPFGTIEGYALIPYPSKDLNTGLLEKYLYKAALALGIDNAICMVDFIVSDDQIYLLEMTPRPGGDCIPHLLRRSGRVDIISLALDFAGQKRMSIPGEQPNGQYVGLRLHAEKPGKIIKFDADRIKNDSRTCEIGLIRSEGHQVTMPPDDYDSWYLGYVIFQPADGVALEKQCNEIRQELILETVQ